MPDSQDGGIAIAAAITAAIRIVKAARRALRTADTLAKQTKIITNFRKAWDAIIPGGRTAFRKKHPRLAKIADKLVSQRGFGSITADICGPRIQRGGALSDSAPKSTVRMSVKI